MIQALVFQLIGFVFSGTDYTSPKSEPYTWKTTDAKKASVVVFMSAFCPCSLSHEIHLKDLHRQWSKKGYSFIGIHSNADEVSDSKAIGRFQSVAFPFPILSDKEALIANELKALKTPHAFLIDAEDRIVYKGALSDSSDASKAEHFFLKDALEAFDKKQKIEPSSTRPLGCMIQRP